MTVLEERMQPEMKFAIVIREMQDGLDDNFSRHAYKQCGQIYDTIFRSVRVLLKGSYATMTTAL